MRRLIVDLLLAHVIASYAVLVGMTVADDWPPAEVWLVAPAAAPAAVWDVMTNPPLFARPAVALATIVGSYVAGFAAVLAWRRLVPRDFFHNRRRRRRRAGLCTECGYNLTGNKSGLCPECGVHVVPKARLMLRRGR